MFHLVALAASAGGLPALGVVLSMIPADFPLPIVVVQHLDPDHQSWLAAILGRRTRLHVQEGADADVLTPGTVYIAPPDHHMEIADREGGSRIVLTDSARVRYVRPSADRLFVSASSACGSIIGVVLSGNGSDGADGAAAIRRAGGVVIAQDEASSKFFGMPNAAIARGVVDYVLPLDEIAPALMRLVRADRS